MHFLYFTDQRPPKSLLEVANWNLAHAFDSLPSQKAVSNGPDGMNGWLLIPANQDLSTQKVDRANQTWRRVSARIDPERRWWVGFWNDQLPKPEDLARAKQIDGELLKLADDNSWLVPIAKQYYQNDGLVSWRTPIPRRVELTDDGDFVYGAVLPRYARLFESALAFEDARARAAGEAVEGEKAQFTFANLSESAAEAIATNYRVSLAELMALGAWSDETPAEVMRIVVNERDYMLLLKKRMADLGFGSSPNGPEPETPDDSTPTAPTSPTSEPTRSGYTANKKPPRKRG